MTNTQNNPAELKLLVEQEKEYAVRNFYKILNINNALESILDRYSKNLLDAFDSIRKENHDLVEENKILGMAMKTIWLLENSNIEDDDNNKIIWSPDADCEQIHEGYKIIGQYQLVALKDNQPKGTV